MTGYGKMNLLGILILPAAATLAAAIMFGPRVDTLLTVFGMNAVPMLIGGLISALLLRGSRKAGGKGRTMALWPTWIPAIIGIFWYAWDALLPADHDPGRVYIAGPQYLVMIAVLVGVISWVACLAARSKRAG